MKFIHCKRNKLKTLGNYYFSDLIWTSVFSLKKGSVFTTLKKN